MNTENLLNAIREDYLRFMNRNSTRDLTDITKQMVADFNKNLRYEEGRKYIKIITDGSVWGFIVKADDNKFKAGDILKPASWSAPTRNFARGNVIDNSFGKISWTGAM